MALTHETLCSIDMPDIMQTENFVCPPERQRALHLADGRRLAWAEWGPLAGTPVLFCTGAAMSGWLGFGCHHLAELNLRLLAIDRPGLGSSDPHPDKTLESWAADMREFIAIMSLENPLAVGFSQGAPFALALADCRLVRAVALVSGQDDLSHAKLRPLLAHEVATMIAAVERDPVAFERGVVQTATAQGLWDLVTSMSGDRDRKIYESDAFAKAYRRCLDEGFLQGARGYARDLVNALCPWRFAPETISVPVDMWYGKLDTSTVHSPDFGATLASRCVHSSLTVEPGEGGSILWTRAGDILTKLASHR